MRKIPAHRETAIQGVSLGGADDLITQRNLYQARSLVESGMFATNSSIPLMAVLVGLLLLRKWYYGLDGFALLAVLIAIGAIVGRQRTESATTVVGLSLYGIAALLILVLLSDFKIQNIGVFISGALLLFLSFSMWVSSLFLLQTAAWMTRSVASGTLTAAVVGLGSAVSSWQGP